MAGLTNAERQKRWRDKNPEKSRMYVKKYRDRYPERFKDRELKRRYGISLKDFNSLVELQEGACAICLQISEENDPLHVDHCHKTGKVRGLLCGKCNKGIGLFDDDPRLLVKANEYVKKHL